MIDMTYEDSCVGCPQGCVHCGRKAVQPVLHHLYCDICKKDSEAIYRFDGRELCLGCMLGEINAEEINEENFFEYA